MTKFAAMFAQRRAARSTTKVHEGQEGDKTFKAVARALQDEDKVREYLVTNNLLKSSHLANVSEEKKEMQIDNAIMVRQQSDTNETPEQVAYRLQRRR